MATERIQIVVTENGSRVVRRNIEDIGAGAERSRSAVDMLRRTLALIGAGAVVRQLRSMADEFANIRNQLIPVTSSTEQLNVVTRELVGVANRSSQSFAATANVYARFARLSNTLGLSQREVLDIVESLGRAAELSGTSFEETSSALARFASNLESGKIQTREFRAILVQLPVVANAIGEQLGLTTAQLRASLDDGELSASELVRALQNARGQILEMSSRVVSPLSDAFRTLRNNLVAYVGATNESFGVTRRLSQLVLLLADNVETLGKAFGAAAVTIGIIFGQQAIGAAIRGLNLLALAIARNPIGALGLALAATIGLLSQFSTEVRLSAESSATLRDVAVAAWEEIQSAASSLLTFLRENFGQVGEFIARQFEGLNVSISGVLRFLASAADTVIGIWLGVVKATIAAFNVLPGAFRDIFTRSMNAAIGAVESGINGIVGALNTVLSLTGRTVGEVSLNRLEEAAAGGSRNLGEAVREGFLEGFNANLVQGTLSRVLDRAETVAQERLRREQAERDALARATAGLDAPGTIAKPPEAEAGKAGRSGKQAITFAEILRDLEREGQLLRLNARDRAIANEILNAERTLRRDLTQVELEQITAVLKLNESLNDQAKILEEIRGPQNDLRAQFTALNALYEQGAISLDEYNTKLRQLRIASLDLEKTIGAGLERGILKLQEEFSNLGKLAEDTLVNSFRKAEDALVEFVSKGKLDFKGLVDSILADITRLAVRQAITGPLAGLLGGGGGGGGGLLDSLFSGLGSLLGFNSGGSMMVGGRGGIDQNVMSINGEPVARVSRGERIDVVPSNQQANSVSVNMYITTNDAESFVRAENQILARAATALSRAQQRNR